MNDNESLKTLATAYCVAVLIILALAVVGGVFDKLLPGYFR
jgi:hypothetical protein